MVWVTDCQALSSQPLALSFPKSLIGNPECGPALDSRVRGNDTISHSKLWVSDPNLH